MRCGQVHRYGVADIAEAFRGLGDLPVAAVAIERRPGLLRGAIDDGSRHRRLRADHRRHIGLQDGRLFTGDLL